MAGLQFALTARFKTVSAPYGTDIVYYFHRQISILAFFLILAHPLILFIFDPPTIKLVNIFAVETPWRARAAVVALLAMALLVILSVWRKKLKIEYYAWRIWHGILATLLIGLGMVHIILVGYHFNAPWKQTLWIVYTIFWVCLLVYTRIIRPLRIMMKPYIVDRVIPERGNAWTISIKPMGHAGLQFAPGQFAWINVASSPFRHRDHPFTISSSADNKDEMQFTIKELGDFTKAIGEIKPGTRVFMEGAYGIFSPDHHPHARNYVYIAGGVGITPAISALRTFRDRQEKRPILLIYANRDWDSVIFREEIEELEKSLNLRVVHVLEKPPNNWKGYQGFITAEILDKELPEKREPNNTEIFICGPGPMMDAVEKALDQIQFPLGDFHSERFDLV